MSKNYESKAVLIEEIKTLVDTCQSAVLVDYRGLTVEEDTALRKKFREAGVTYKVLKNTYIKRAVDELNVTGLDEHLNGPTAVAFGRPIACGLLAARGGISCSCGGKDCAMEIHGASVDLVCRSCGGKLRIPAATDEDLDRLCCHYTLTIKGQN